MRGVIPRFVNHPRGRTLAITVRPPQGEWVSDGTANIGQP